MTLESLSEFARSFWVVWMMALFVGIVAWVYWPKRRRELEDLGNIPLREEDD